MTFHAQKRSSPPTMYQRMIVLTTQMKEKILRLKLNTELSKILANFSWLLVDKVLRMGVGLFTSISIARYLGVEKFGNLNYSLAFVTLFSTISSLGINAIVIRSIVQEPENKKQLLGTAFYLKLIGGLISLAITVGCISVLRTNDLQTIILVSVIALSGIVQSFDTIDIWFQSQVNSKYSVLASNLAFFIASFFRLYLISAQAPLILFGWAILLELIISGIFLIIAYKIDGYSPFQWSWSLPLARKILAESWPMIFAGLSMIAYMKIDQIMLGEMIGNTSVSIYSVAARISEVWYFIPVAVNASFSSSIFKAKEVSESLYYEKIEKVARLLGLLALATALPVSFFSERIILILFGNEYIAAAPVLSIHIWASPFIFMGSAASSWYIAEKLNFLILRRTLIALFINLVLNLLLIPILAEVGAAIATVFSYAFGSVFANATHPKTHKIFQIQIKSMFPLFLKSLFLKK